MDLYSHFFSSLALIGGKTMAKKFTKQNGESVARIILRSENLGTKCVMFACRTLVIKDIELKCYINEIWHVPLSK